MSFERNYQVKNLSKQRRQYSTLIPNIIPATGNKLNPWYITGFMDAVKNFYRNFFGSFIVSIIKDPKTRTGWNIQVRFKISLHQKDLSVLEQAYFLGVGKIDKTGKDRDSLSYVISSPSE